MTNHPPAFDGLPCTPVDPTRDARDPRRTWARLLPRATFTNPAARLLAEWADAILSEDGWEAWTAAHPKEGAPL